MPNVRGRVSVELEVSAFENEICGEHEIVPGPGTEHRAIVADAADQASRVRAMRREFPDSIDDRGFSHSQVLYDRSFGEHQACREFFTEGSTACRGIRFSREFTE